MIRLIIKTFSIFFILVGAFLAFLAFGSLLLFLISFLSPGGLLFDPLAYSIVFLPLSVLFLSSGFRMFKLEESGRKSFITRTFPAAITVILVVALIDAAGGITTGDWSSAFTRLNYFKIIFLSIPQIFLCFFFTHGNVRNLFK